MHVVPRFEGIHFFLSNFYEAPITFSMGDEEVTFQTGEAAFQAAKFRALLNPAEKARYVRSVADAPTPAKAKYAGRAVKIDTDTWDGIKVECMRQVVYQKFSQHPDLRSSLLKTGDSMLVEGNDWGDTYWGRVDGRGYNKLGVILMETRGYFLWQSR